MLLRRSVVRLALFFVLIGAGAWNARSPSAGAAERDRVIVRFDHDVATAERIAMLQAAGGRVVRDLHLIDGLGAELDRRAARELARAPGVIAVSRDRVVRPSGKPAPCGGRAADWCASELDTAYVQSTRADKAWSDRQSPVTGSGVGVAVIDTGIAGELPDFAAGDGQSRVIATAVTNPDATTATDRYGHGTHVAGLVAGNGRRLAATDPLYNRYIGTAPDANLISIKASDDAGQATIIDVIDGLQLAVDHKDDYGIRVVNLSLNSTEAQSYATDPLDAAAEAAWFAGLVVVTAAGNRGTAADAVSYAPANDPFVITVGGVDDQGTKTTDDDALAAWSSRGMTQDQHAKPDIVAPAAHIVATAGSPERLRHAVPGVHRRRQVLPRGRHLDGEPDRRRHRGGSAAGASDVDARSGQAGPHHAHPPHARRRRRGCDRSRSAGPPLRPTDQRGNRPQHLA